MFKGFGLLGTFLSLMLSAMLLILLWHQYVVVHSILTRHLNRMQRVNESSSLHVVLYELFSMAGYLYYYSPDNILACHIKPLRLSRQGQTARFLGMGYQALPFSMVDARHVRIKKLMPNFKVGDEVLISGPAHCFRRKLLAVKHQLSRAQQTVTLNSGVPKNISQRAVIALVQNNVLNFEAHKSRLLFYRQGGKADVLFDHLKSFKITRISQAVFRIRFAVIGGSPQTFALTTEHT